MKRNQSFVLKMLEQPTDDFSNRPKFKSNLLMSDFGQVLVQKKLSQSQIKLIERDFLSQLNDD